MKKTNLFMQFFVLTLSTFSHADDLQGVVIELRRDLSIPIYKENVAIQDGLEMANFRQINRSEVHCEILKPGSSRQGYQFPRGTKFELSTETPAYYNGDLVVGARYAVVDSDVEISVYPAGFNETAPDIIKEHPEVLSASALKACFRGLADVNN